MLLHGIYTELRNMDDVLKPFLLGLSHCAANPKIGLYSISGVNKLVSYHAIREVRSLFYHFYDYFPSKRVLTSP